MKISIIHLSGIGNTVSILPMINKIKRIYNDCKIDILLSKHRGSEVILKNNQNINNIYYFDENIPENKIKKILSLYNFSKRLPKYDLVYTTYPNQGIFSAILMFFIGKIRIQHEYSYGSFLLSSSIKIKYSHFVEQNLSLVFGKNIKSDFSLTHNIAESDNNFATKYMLKLNNKIIIGIHPGGFNDMEYKQYSITKWIELIDSLQKKYENICFIIFGGPSEDLSKFTESESLKIVNNIALSKTIALISKVDVFLSNDSGLGHIASIFNKKQIVLFNATDPKYSRPYSKNTKVITPEDYTSFYTPHEGLTGPINYNINNIKISDIINEVENLI